MPLITLTAPTLAGGIGRNLVNLAQTWIAGGVDVDLVLDRREHDCYLDQLPTGATVFTSGGSNAWTDLPWLVRYLRMRRPDAIITPVPRHTIWALRARRLARVSVPVVANVHNDYSMTLTAVTSRKRASRIAQMRRHYPRCDAIVPVSEGAGAAFSKVTGIPSHRLTPIPNPVVTPALYAQARETPAHPWFEGDGGPPIIVWVGRIEHAKNLPLLVEAFDRLCYRTACRLVIIGDGADREAVAARAAASPHAGNIALLGHQPNPYAYIARSAVLALSSRWEGLGNVLVEAMALGVAVAACDCASGPAEILRHGRYGPLAPVDDVDALAAAIERSLRHPVDSRILRGAASAYAAEAVAQRYLQILGIAGYDDGVIASPGAARS